METSLVERPSLSTMPAGSATEFSVQFMPALTLEQAMERRDIVYRVFKDLMKNGVDYGTIEGCERPTLLQPGADKLCSLFGLVIEYEIIEAVKDWDGKLHGEPFFYYEIRGIARRGNVTLGQGIGSCSSWEQKYRWRKAERTCPQCHAPAVLKSRQGAQEWFCWKKRGGCGATFPLGDASIESQVVGRIPNPDVFDVVNTVQKMGWKRCKISTTINATSASEFFTQDLEDFEPAEDGKPDDKGKQKGKPSQKADGKAEGNGNEGAGKPDKREGKPEGNGKADEVQRAAFGEVITRMEAQGPEQKALLWKLLRAHQVESLAASGLTGEIPRGKAQEIYRQLRALADAGDVLTVTRDVGTTVASPPVSAPPRAPGHERDLDETEWIQLAGHLRQAYGKGFNQAKVNDWVKRHPARTAQELLDAAERAAFEAEAGR